MATKKKTNRVSEFMPSDQIEWALDRLAVVLGYSVDPIMLPDGSWAHVMQRGESGEIVGIFPYSDDVASLGPLAGALVDAEYLGDTPRSTKAA
jgi:hypothetical protein